MKTKSTITTNTLIDEREKSSISIEKKKKKKKAEVFEEKEIFKILLSKNEKYNDSKIIEKNLNKYYFLKNLEKVTKKELIRKMILVEIKPGDVFCKEGYIGEYFYIVKSGEVELSSSTTAKPTIQIIKEGESFGEYGLLNSERGFTASAVSTTFLWVLSKKNYKKITEFVNKLQYEENKKYLDSINFLKILDTEQKNVLSLNFNKEYFELGSYIFRNGDDANCLFIIKEGEINCNKSGKVVRVLEKGEIFGEKAILIDSKRSLDCTAKTNCVLLSLSKDALIKVLGNEFRDKIFIAFLKNSISNSQYFTSLDGYIIDKLFSKFHLNNFGFNQDVFRSGYKKSSKLIVVIEGALVASTTKEVLCRRGNILFEEEVFNASEKSLEYTILSQPDCLFMELDIQILVDELQGDLKNMARKQNLITSLSNVVLFKNLTKNKLEKISQIVTENYYASGKDIITEGEEGFHFYIIKSGCVDIIFKGNFIKTLYAPQYFGERALLMNDVRKATCRANGEVVCYVLNKEDFKEIIESNLKDFLVHRIYLQDNSLQLTDLEFVKDLGQGSFGEVLLVYSKKNNYYYALKGCLRKQIDAEKLHSRIDIEKEILFKLDHPFIVKMVKTLKDNNQIFFLMEYIKGKELFCILEELGVFTPYQCKFFTASILSALEYLHKRKLIYRDIKPNNIMINEIGHLKLIDFGTCKEIEEKTNTIIGTPHYMAPEVILGEDYSFQADIWSASVCLFEFSNGYLPFGEDKEDILEIYSLIERGKFFFSNKLKDELLKELLTKLLTRELSGRMTSIPIILEHPYFKDFSYEELNSLNIQPAYVVKSKENNQILKHIPLKKYLEENFKQYENEELLHMSKTKQEEYDKWYSEF